MKKMLLASALACLLQDVLNRRLLFKTNRQQPLRNHHPSSASFLELEAKKTVDATKEFVAAQKMLKRNPANIRKWIARFYYFKHYTPLEARYYVLTIIA